MARTLSAAQMTAAGALSPALELLPPVMDSAAARIILIAIALQESKLIHRWQVVDLKQPNVKGPARGLLQFERGGGVTGVLLHAASADYAISVCKARGVSPTVSAVYAAIEVDDVLAFALGRLLLWTDPKRLPVVGDVEGAWQLYLRTWRPGAAERDPVGLRAKWAENYETAMTTVVSK